MQCFNILVAGYCSVITRASYDKTKEEFEDTKEIIRSRKSKKDRQTTQWPKDKGQKATQRYTKHTHKTKYLVT